jgi:hypothetical protein
MPKYWWVLALVACKPILKPSHETGYIIGENDILRVKGEGDGQNNQPRARDLYSSVVLLTKLGNGKARFCSGTLIAPDKGSKQLRVLTNHHCFAETGSNGIGEESILLRACSETIVYAGVWDGFAEQPSVTYCMPGTLRSSFELDTAEFTLSKALPDKFVAKDFWPSDKKLAMHQKLLAVHYPDLPDQLKEFGLQKFKLPVASYTEKDCQLLGRFSTSLSAADKSLGYSLQHSCDIEHGSSGSGLIDAESGKLVGVNWGGISYKVDGKAQSINAATSIHFVQAFLDGRQPSEVSQDIVEESLGQGESANVEARGKFGSERDRVTKAAPGCSKI